MLVTLSTLVYKRQNKMEIYSSFFECTIPDFREVMKYTGIH